MEGGERTATKESVFVRWESTNDEVPKLEKRTHVSRGSQARAESPQVTRVASEPREPTINEPTNEPRELTINEPVVEKGPDARRSPRERARRSPLNVSRLAPVR